MQQSLVYAVGWELCDFSCVDDVFAAFITAAHISACYSKVIFFGSIEFVSFADLATMLMAFESGAYWALTPFPVEPKTIDLGDYYRDFSLVRDLLGWTPSVPLAEALERTLHCFCKHHVAYLWATLSPCPFPSMPFREPKVLITAQLSAVEMVIRDGPWILGSLVEPFEATLRASAARPPRWAWPVALIDAIELGLRALGIGAGDGVITTALSAYAPSNPAGFCDLCICRY